MDQTKLICINTKPLEGNSIAPPVEEGEKYQLLHIHKCECGQDHFDVGLVSEIGFVNCYKCKKQLPKTREGFVVKADYRIHWCHPSRFNAL